jgi:hypothetical protein
MSICKIPPDLPLLKGGITPLWQRGVGGDFPMFMSIVNISQPKIGGLYIRVLHQLSGIPFQHRPAIFKDISIMNDGQDRTGILL